MSDAPTLRLNHSLRLFLHGEKRVESGPRPVDRVRQQVAVGAVDLLIEDHDPLVVSCDDAQALPADQVWTEAGIRVESLDRTELAQARAAFIDTVEQMDVRHLGDPVLLDAIRPNEEADR